jgi:DNA-binding MarR family transcriptional regulator
VAGELPDLDPIVHGQIRLAALSLLAGVASAEFTFLRDKIGTTDGNLSVHLAKLEAAGYVSVEKKFVDKKPRSLYRMTETGRAAFLGYVKRLKALLGKDLTRRES